MSKVCPDCGVNLIRDDQPYCQVCWMTGSYYQHELWVHPEEWPDAEEKIWCMNFWFKAGLSYFRRGLSFYGLYDLWFNYWLMRPGWSFWP